MLGEKRKNIRKMTGIKTCFIIIYYTTFLPVLLDNIGGYKSYFYPINFLILKIRSDGSKGFKI